MANPDQILEFNGHTVRVGDLPETSIAALLSLGFSTKLKNSHAGVKAGILGTNPETAWSPEEIEEEAREAGLDVWGSNEATADALCAHYQRKMFEAILSGIEPSQRKRGGPRLNPDDKLRKEIAIAALEKVAAKAGKALPKRSGKNADIKAFEELLAEYLAVPAFSDYVEKEFAKRKKESAKGIDSLAAALGL